MNKQHILVTGGAGFIGSHLAERLLAEGHHITVIDNFDPFYGRSVKEANLAVFCEHPNCRFIEMDILNEQDYQDKLTGHYDVIVHLAAKAGVRPSIENPVAYQDVNVKGTQNLLEFARKRGIHQFVFASSSSVYGINPHFPWKESDAVLNPISPYASTKISGELLGHVYSHLYKIRFIALRFFTVYGPRQRPDLAVHLFSKKILAGEPIRVFGDGSTRRDYTYVTDTVDGICSAINYRDSMYEVINLGNHRTVPLSEMIETIEDVFGKKAIIERLPEQPGDVPVTYADINKAGRLLNYHPRTTFREGVVLFREWMLKQLA